MQEVYGGPPMRNTARRISTRAALAMLGAGPAARCRLDDSTERDCLFALQKLLDFGLGLGQADSWILLPIQFDGGNLPTWSVGKSLNL